MNWTLRGVRTETEVLGRSGVKTKWILVMALDGTYLNKI
jgi:hypothetical protein